MKRMTWFDTASLVRLTVVGAMNARRLYRCSATAMLLAACWAMAASPAAAYTYTWGNAGTGYWNVSSNWTGGAAGGTPLSADNILLSNGGTIDLSSNSYSITEAGSTASGIAGTITDGSLSLGGNMYVKSGTINANLTFAGTSASRLWIGGNTSATVYLGGTNSGMGAGAGANCVLIGHTNTGAAAGTVKLTSAGALGTVGTTIVYSGTLDLNGQNNVTGTAISLNSDRGPASNFVNNSTAVTYTHGITLFSGTTNSIGGTGSLTLSGVVGGNTGIGFTKIGTGVLTLSGANTYTGATKINDGKLSIGSAGTINSTSGITIDGSGAELNYNSSTALSKAISFGASGGKISGTGTIATAVTVSSLDILSPGNSPGTQNYTAGLALNGGGKYIWEINSQAGTYGDDPGWDKINVTGGLTLGATSDNQFQINVTGLAGVGSAPTSTTTWSILSYDSLSGAFSSDKFSVTTAGLDSTWSSGTWSVGSNANTLQLTYSVIPEPGTLVLFAAALLSLITYAWRKRK